MKTLVISDLHGDLRLARKAACDLRPDLLLCCGDWGDPDEIGERDLQEFLDLCPLLTTFGNHDPLEILARLKNRDGTAALLGQGEVRVFEGLRLAGIGGIWAKSHRLPCYVTDDEVAGWAAVIAAAGPVDILLTHGCPVGLADLTPAGRHGGQRCFLDAFKTVSPRIHLCGHLQIAQERRAQERRQGHQRRGDSPGKHHPHRLRPRYRGLENEILGSCLSEIGEPFNHARSRGRTPRGRACRRA